jgi:hypothetical protein
MAGAQSPLDSAAPVATVYFSNERRSIEWVRLIFWQVICASSPRNAPTARYGPFDSHAPVFDIRTHVR